MTPKTRVAVVLAAGMGERLMEVSDVPKPLVQLDGKSLLHRNLQCLRRAGVEEIIVVLGYRGEEIRQALGPDDFHRMRSCGLRRRQIGIIQIHLNHIIVKIQQKF